MADSWDDADFEEPVMPGAADEAEEQFKLRGMQQIGEEEDDWNMCGLLFPALLVDLSSIMAEAEGDPAGVRDAVLETLQHDWTGKTMALMEQGLCWHVPRCKSQQRRLEYEAAHPDSVLTTFEYPPEIDGLSTSHMFEILTRRTPSEACNLMKQEIANARRPLKWQSDMAIELEELAERESIFMEMQQDALRALEDARREKSDTLERMHASHANNPNKLSAQEVSSMLAHLDDLDARILEAESFVKESVTAEGGVASDSETRTLIDVFLDLIFDHHPNEPSTDVESWAERQASTAEKKRAMRRMWGSTFGRLPVASELTLKHAPPKAAPKSAANARPRMLVPPPPGAASSASLGRSRLRSTTETSLRSSSSSGDARTRTSRDLQPPSLADLEGSNVMALEMVRSPYVGLDDFLKLAEGEGGDEEKLASALGVCQL